MKNCYLIFVFLFSVTASYAQTLEDDRAALMALFNASGGNSRWAVRTGWGQPGSPCGWFGVTCENDRVVKLDLADNFLSGTLPPEIGNLTALTLLNLEGEGPEFRPLSGVLPPELGNLKNLEFLNLADNSFDISSDFGILGVLTKLKTLSFTPNAPLSDELTKLTDLEELNLFSSNVFGAGNIGAIPAFIKDFTKLKSLFIFNAGITGDLPAELGTLSNLEKLVIRKNLGLNPAGIPATLLNLQKLKQLDLSQINITGNIPASLGSLTNLTHIDLSQNNLTGTIPSSFTGLVNLENLNLEGNYLSGIIPDFSNISSLSQIDLNYNRFTFNGMEENVAKLSTYLIQRKVPMNVNGMLRTTGQSGILYAEVGGTLANNTYKWFKNEKLIATNVGNKFYDATELGTYRFEVTNSIVSGLTLVSENYLVDIVMPVTLVSFSGENKTNENILTWKTTLEVNNKGFEIEKSTDAKTFEKIGFIDGNGDSNENKSYKFLDTKPAAKTYYRLKQIDWDGKFEYSRIIMVKQDNAQLSVYPNPAKSEFYLAGLEKEEDIIIRNLQGRIVQEQKVSPAQAINTAKLSNGLYLIKVGEETKKVVIQN